MPNQKFKFDLEGISIRKIKYSDLGDVIYVNRKTLPENYSLQLFLTMYHTYGDIFWVAEDIHKRRIVGYCMNKIEYRVKSFFENKRVTKGHIFSLGVLQEYRRRGIASALLAISMRSMFDKGCDEVFLEVRVSNIPAQNLYKKFLFRAVYRVPHYYADGEDAYVLVVKKSDAESIVNRVLDVLKRDWGISLV